MSVKRYNGSSWETYAGLIGTASAVLTVNAQLGSTYTTQINDAGALITVNNGSTATVSIPTNASVAYPIGTQINIVQIGAGQVIINAATPGTTTVGSTGATVASPRTRTQFSGATAIKVATDTWYVIGDIV